MKLKLTSLFAAVLLSFSAMSAEFDYPELQVVPLASERVRMEAIEEQSQNFLSDLPMQTSALTTILASVFLAGDRDEKKDPDNHAMIMGAVIGGAWLAINTYHSSMYKPYTKTFNQMSKIKVSNERESLLRERIAESRIHQLARHGKRVKWLSFLSNSFASGYMLSKSKSDSNGQMFSILSLLASVGPLIFDNTWEEASKEHKENKKRIYRPILTTGLLPVGNKIAPAALFTLTF